jgi:hypothetical protein
MQAIRVVSPVFEDGYGPMPSFYWGRALLPGAAEYLRDRSHYDVIYLIPYVVAAVIISAIGCWAAPRVGRLITQRPPSFALTASTCLGLLAAASLAIDAGTRLKLWEGPLLMAHGDVRWHCTWLCVLIPAPLLSGAREALRRHLGGGGPSTPR